MRGMKAWSNDREKLVKKRRSIVEMRKKMGKRKE